MKHSFGISEVYKVATIQSEIAAHTDMVYNVYAYWRCKLIGSWHSPDVHIRKIGLLPVACILACMMFAPMSPHIAAKSAGLEGNNMSWYQNDTTSGDSRPLIERLASSPALPNVLFASLQGSQIPVYSLNSGRSWQEVKTVPWLDGGTTTPLRVAIAPRGDPNAPVRLIVGVPDTSDKAGIYRTGDDGESWAHFAIPPEPESYCNEPRYVDFLITSVADPHRLYMSTYCLWAGPTASRGWASAYMSTDAGITWQLIESTVGEVIMSPLNALQIYRKASGGWLESNDGGVNWTLRDFPVQGLVLDTQDSARMYGLQDVTSATSGMSSIDGGQSWAAWAAQPCVEQLSGTRSILIHEGYSKLVAHPTKSNVLFIQCGNGLFRSDDGGESWQKLSQWHGRFLSADHGNPSRLLWVRDDGLWASIDDGNQWTQISQSYHEPLQFPLWQEVYVPPDPLCLQPLTARSQVDIWAKTCTNTEEGSILVSHWDGEAWSPAASIGITGTLGAMTMFATDDVWAVASSGGRRTLGRHYLDNNSRPIYRVALSSRDAIG